MSVFLNFICLYHLVILQKLNSILTFRASFPVTKYGMGQKKVTSYKVITTTIRYIVKKTTIVVRC